MDYKAKRYEAHPAAAESVIQKHVISHLVMRLPGAVIHHSPNEVNRSGKAAMIEVAKKKSIGMLPGFPDLFVLWRGVLGFFEVKKPKQYPTAEQRDVMDRLKANGADVVMVGRSVSDAEDFVIAMRAVLAEKGKGAGG